MKRIILHWTAGAYQPNSTDYEHYHYLVTGDGLVVKGKYKPEDNKNCNDGKYAAHTGGGNTGSIGIAMCGMMNYSPNKGFPVLSTLLQKFNVKDFLNWLQKLQKSIIYQLHHKP